MYLLIDNYDSFTYNLYHFLGELGATVEVRRNDAMTVDDAMAMQPEGIIISPGPCTPNEAGISLPLVRACAERAMPLLGVCLGHQSIGQAFGGNVLRAPTPMHGKVSRIHHRGTDIFKEMPDPFQATRYHSLIVDRGTMPNCLTITAETEDGLVMGVSHCDLPIYGVQFHPESIATEDGRRLLGNFLKLSKG